jgi:myo-inositol 2-dehydrogenase/D-chiro-inositol 1-dehydrogenase
MKKLRVGVIGAGRIGRVHAENLAYRVRGATVVAVADVVPESAEKLAAELQVPRWYGDPAPIFADAEIDAVAICSSTDTHAKFIEDAAVAGKHIFCEKPIALNLARIDRALAAVEKAGVKLQVGFNRRFDPSFQRLRKVVANGEIGTPHILRITSRDPAPPPIDYVKVSGGIFLDMTIHDFDMARFMMGDEVVEVYVAGGVMVDDRIGQAGDIDTAVTTLRFRGGAIGVIDNSRKAVYGYDQTVEVFGSAGVANVTNKTPDNVVRCDCTGVHSSLPLYFFVERYAEAYVVEMQEFVNAVLNGTEPPVSGLDGRVPVVMAYAAKKSYDEHRPVRLSEIEA